MNKLGIKRVLIRDKNGDYYRICGISNPSDRFGENYIKLVFPDFKDIPLLTQLNDRKGRFVGEASVESSIQEFSYHYNSGVSHFKKSSDKFVDQKKGMPKLHDINGLHLLRFQIYSLIGFEKFPQKKIAKTDLVLKDEFKELPRMIEFAITADPDIHYINVSVFKPLNHYEWELDEKGVYMSIGDLESQEKSGPLIVCSQLFRYDDPTEYFRGTTSFGAKLFVMKNKLCFYCRKYLNSFFRRSGF